MTHDDLKVLLIQIRPDDMKEHEYELVKTYGGLRDGQVVRLDIFRDDAGHAVLDGVNALVIGGSGDYLISRGDIPAEVGAIASLAREARGRGMPVLGICFGAQILTAAFGGSVHLDAERAETGTYDIKKTDAAGACPVFSGLPQEFAAQLGHKDHLLTLPEGSVHLASSERSRFQAFTFPGEPVYAVTFHPELDEQAMYHRLDYYATEYDLSDSSVLDEVRARIRSAPEANKVIRLFLEKVVTEGRRYPTQAADAQETAP